MTYQNITWQKHGLSWVEVQGLGQGFSNFHELTLSFFFPENPMKAKDMKRKVVCSIIIGCSSFVKRLMTTEAKLELFLCHRIMVQKKLHEKSNKH